MLMLIAPEIPWGGIVGNFNSVMDQMDRDDGNQTKRIYRYCSN